MQPFSQVLLLLRQPVVCTITGWGRTSGPGPTSSWWWSFLRQISRSRLLLLRNLSWPGHWSKRCPDPGLVPHSGFVMLLCGCSHSSCCYCQCVCVCAPAPCEWRAATSSPILRRLFHLRVPSLSLNVSCFLRSLSLGWWSWSWPHPVVWSPALSARAWRKTFYPHPAAPAVWHIDHYASRGSFYGVQLRLA